MYANGAHVPPPHNMGMPPPPIHGGMPMSYYGPPPTLAGPPPGLMVSAPVVAQPPPAAAGHVGSHTNSKDPICVKSRLFVGNLNTYRVNREELVKLFAACGNVLSASVFKGYAFVQYATPIEAKLGVETFNGYTWEGSELDVKLAFTGPYKNKQKGSVDSPPVFVSNTMNAAESCTANKNYCKTFERREFEPHNGEGKDDVLICGECQFRTNDLNDFAEHRSHECYSDDHPPTEPTSIQCFTCDDTFASSWNLLQHLIEKHNLNLYRQDDGEAVERRGPRTPSSLPPEDEPINGSGPRTPPPENEPDAPAIQDESIAQDLQRAQTPPEEAYDADAPSPQPPSPEEDEAV
uniref:RRM domain-containing protein n=1 Tax=Panagrellus redivivus TaxID=6233 RepID=A0A7E4VLQ7_PANRE